MSQSVSSVSLFVCLFHGLRGGLREELHPLATECSEIRRAGHLHHDSLVKLSLLFSHRYPARDRALRVHPHHVLVDPVLRGGRALDPRHLDRGHVDAAERRREHERHAVGAPARAARSLAPRAHAGARARAEEKRNANIKSREEARKIAFANKPQTHIQGKARYAKSDVMMLKGIFDEYDTDKSGMARGARGGRAAGSGSSRSW